MIHIRWYYSSENPSWAKTSNHKTAKCANKKWTEVVAKGYNAEAIDESGRIVMKHENGISYRAVD